MKLLLIAGVPIFILTFCFSLIWHHTAHAAAGKYLSPAEASTEVFPVKPIDQPPGTIPSIAGLGATAALALASFALFIHYPRNLVAASLAFVNASSRIPDAWRAFLSTLTGSEPAPAGDEWIALHSLHFKDPTAPLVILGFYLLTIIFFSIFVVHDARMVPRKWILAFVLFLVAMPGEGIVWGILSRIIS